MAIPTLIFVMSFMLKRHLKRSQQSVNVDPNFDGINEYVPLQGDTAT